jgi:IS1 family transposase
MLVKVAQLPPFTTTLVVPDPEDAAITLEWDELWSFGLKKAHPIWVWIAPCHKIRQVVGYALGDRSKQTCLCLWQALPSASRKGHCITDFWGAYQAVLPDEQHKAMSKETGETARARALEQHTVPTLGSLCTHNLIVLKVEGDTRGLFASLSPSLQ